MKVINTVCKKCADKIRALWVKEKRARKIKQGRQQESGNIKIKIKK